jgi:hypothetical protein
MGILRLLSLLHFGYHAAQFHPSLSFQAPPQSLWCPFPAQPQTAFCIAASKLWRSLQHVQKVLTLDKKDHYWPFGQINISLPISDFSHYR